MEYLKVAVFPVRSFV